VQLTKNSVGLAFDICVMCFFPGNVFELHLLCAESVTKGRGETLLVTGATELPVDILLDKLNSLNVE
jgi:hypothetical protein